MHSPRPCRISRIKRTLIARLPQGIDLLKAIMDCCHENDIVFGCFTVIGAASSASLAFYDQKKKEYRKIVLPKSKEWEIVSCSGNLSLRDGKPFVHAHGVIADARGRTRGGHFVEGTVIFAAEAVIEEMDGRALKRGYDEKTGLWLWQ